MKYLITTIAAVLLVGCADEGSNLLVLDANKGDIVAVKQHLAAGTDVNAKDLSQRTPLMAATEGNIEGIKQLIAEGADSNVSNLIK